MHTAQHIVSKCLASKLLAKGRTIILVTHHIGLCLPVSSYLVELAHGQVLRQGSIQSLREKGLLQKAIEDEKKYDTFAETEDIPDIPAGEADPLQRGDPSTGKLIEAEARAEGRVSMRTYLTYIRAAGTWCWVFSVLLMLCIRMINVASQVGFPCFSEMTCALTSRSLDLPRKMGRSVPEQLPYKTITIFGPAISFRIYLSGPPLSRLRCPTVANDLYVDFCRRRLLGLILYCPWVLCKPASVSNII